MSEKRFQKTRIVDKWGGIYDSKTDEILDVNDVEHKLNEQQATINKVCELLEEEDIFSDEATEHDINAYIELQKFDNKDAYYLACGIKKAIKLLKGDDV